jgi:hypothetical protein
VIGMLADEMLKITSKKLSPSQTFPIQRSSSISISKPRDLKKPRIFGASLGLQKTSSPWSAG